MTEGLRIEVPLAEVRAAVAEYAKTPDADVHIEPWLAARHVAGAVRFDLGDSTRAGQQAWARLHRQVFAELNRLAKVGVLVKVYGGELTPDGRRLRRNESRFYTNEGYRRAARRAADLAAEQSAARDHAEAICARLRKLVIPPRLSGNGVIRLDLDHWDILLELAEAGDRAKVAGQQ